MEGPMRAILIAVFLAVSVPAAARDTPDRDGRGFHARLYERYCEKLREGSQAYALFVRRMNTVYGYTYTDFLPATPGGRAKADCRVAATKEEPRRRD
jgi:hypothetical protein